ncbi:alpha/beta fold hydrolase [Rhizobium multihospitium]|uniref:Pimeloyl-ACP methyl ester carboxylesterase n=1 Tax=Rhizobium multihospitium TaxID=410764 RepID=A0A1C3XCW8_9HYPH|nr:alpha/beta hydrolase [Rhizobium multihospitium]SCB50103.1 Pimeloyl-ACP methyl ester carboxylesterase [Rhizobium multihospitium]
MVAELEVTNTLQVKGKWIAFSQVGKGYPVALLHGIPTSRLLWRHVVPLLAARGCEVTAIDLLGYGQSDQPDDTDLGIAAQASLIGELLETTGWNRGALVGHDIGGGIAQLVAVDRPPLVDRLVLVDTIAYDSFPVGPLARLKDPVWDTILAAPDFDLKKGLRKSFEAGMVHADRVTPELIAMYETPFAGVEGRHAYLRAARALRTDELATRMAEVEALKLPALVLWGEQDGFQPIAYGERLAAALENGRLLRIMNAGHFSPEDQPEVLAERILEFSVDAQEQEWR